MTRTRWKYEGNISGYQNLNGVKNYQVRNSSDEISRCVDLQHTTGQPFTVDKHICSGGLINYGPKGGSTCSVNYRCLNIPDNVAHPAHGTPFDTPTDSAMAIQVLKRSNPSRSDVELPVALFELREIPQLLHKEGNKIIELANKNLQYQFGIAPTVNDLIKLLCFVDAVDSRVKNLKALNESGIRRKVSLWSGSTSGQSSNASLNSTVVSVSGYYKWVTKVHKWGFVEWFPSHPRIWTEEETRRKAWEIAYGLTLDFNTLWQALPWSWLIDWCSNVGDVLEASRNTADVSHSVVQLMTRQETVAEYVYTQGGQYTSPCRVMHVTKQRTLVPNVSIEAQLPILSGRQLSILGSIGVTRRVPRVM